MFTEQLNNRIGSWGTGLQAHADAGFASQLLQHSHQALPSPPSLKVAYTLEEEPILPEKMSKWVEVSK